MPLTEFTVSFLIEQFLKSWLEKKKKQKRAEEIAAATAKILNEEQNVLRKIEPGLYSDSDEDWHPPVDEILFEDDEDVGDFGVRKKVLYFIFLSMSHVQLTSMDGRIVASSGNGPRMHPNFGYFQTYMHIR